MKEENRRTRNENGNGNKSVLELLRRKKKLYMVWTYETREKEGVLVFEIQ